MEISCCITRRTGYISSMTPTSSHFKVIGNDINPEWTPADIRSMIHTAKRVRVWFRKKDGTIRSLIGTVDIGYLKETGNLPRTYGQRFVPDHQICLFDTEKGEWRSFRAENMIQVEVLS